MIYNSPAKINICLDVLRKRNDGYHELKMIMQTVSLYDKLDIEKADEIIFTSDDKTIPEGNKSFVWKAADLFFKYTGINGGCKIHLYKNIPDGAGLGAGSSNAATTLLALNKIYDAGLTENELINLSSKIGADVAFFILKGTCLCEGIGEKLTKIENKTNPFVLIYKPDFSISTKWAYENLKLNDKPVYNVDDIIENLKDKDYKFDNLFNYIENISALSYPEIESIKNKFKKLGATGSLMSGSGSSVFGIFDNEVKANEALKHFEKERIYSVKFI